MGPSPGLAESTAAAFAQAYYDPPRGLYHAPGRVNLVGEHTAYNDGFVMPMAIDRAVWAAAESFLEMVGTLYERQSLRQPSLYVCQAAAGASLSEAQPGPVGDPPYRRIPRW